MNDTAMENSNREQRKNAGIVHPKRGEVPLDSAPDSAAKEGKEDANDDDDDEKKKRSLDRRTTTTTTTTTTTVIFWNSQGTRRCVDNRNLCSCAFMHAILVQAEHLHHVHGRATSGENREKFSQFSRIREVTKVHHGTPSIAYTIRFIHGRVFQNSRVCGQI